ncbi:MAG: glycerol-3-phosphate dehydrogenase/oxidase, partial [Candidatus Hydrogenedentes bacterium]|nr:glycerol-3-phosphate dehydrogenase/oxidase [Candidatus Hydrogenedentota bacterium]
MTMRRFLDGPVTKEYDAVVIGGGISGAAVAYEAATRGLSVALIEKEDFGGGTSAATSKLIHGGARYLANKEFGLVRESLRERRILSNIAPNFVYPVPVMIATYHHHRTLKAGMIIYDALSYDKGRTWDSSKKIPFHRTLSPERVVELEPIVKRDGLIGAHVYYDCASISPERLTLAFVKSAAAHGADVANHAQVEGFLFSDEKTVCGVKVRDRMTGAEIDLRGRLTINCGGPWVNHVLAMTGRLHGEKRIVRSEGIHLIVRKLTNKHLVALPGAGGKSFLLIPWRGHTLVGPTDKEFLGEPDDYKVTKESVLELIECVNGYFADGARLKYDDVLYAYGGLRPLVESKQHDVRQMSRRYEIQDHAPEGVEGLISVEGGKYTTSRRLAANVLKIAAKKLGGVPRRCVTVRRYLAGCEIPDLAA